MTPAHPADPFQSGPSDQPRKLRSVWSVPGYVPALIAVAAAFGSWGMLLPVVPVAVLDSNGSAALAGASTGVFMIATVITQLFMPRLLRRFTYRSAIGVSAVLLGVPPLLLDLSFSPAMVLAVSVVRGIGFGAMTVSESAIIPELVPRELLGKATGIFGASGGLAQMITLPLGLAVAERVGYTPVWWLALAIAAAGGLACLWIPPVRGVKSDPVADGAFAGSAWRALAAPALAMAAASVAFSLIANFLPAAARDLGIARGTALGGVLLAVVNLAVMVARLVAGSVADRRGEPGALMILGQGFALVGMLGFAGCLAFGAEALWLLIPALLYGAGFGIVQNEALLTMFHRLPASKVGQASAVWNISFDGGQGIGSFLFGAVIVGIGAPWSFVLGAGLILAGLLTGLRSRP